MSDGGKCKRGCALAGVAGEMLLLSMAAGAFLNTPTKEAAERLFRIAQRAYEYDYLGNQGMEAVLSHTAHFGVPDENGEVPPEVVQ
jgi:hypothetical protein